MTNDVLFYVIVFSFGLSFLLFNVWYFRDSQGYHSYSAPRVTKIVRRRRG